MPAGENPAWIAAARRVPAFACDAAFALAPSVYAGPENGIDPVTWATAQVPLPPVVLVRQFATHATTAELLGHEDVLAAHYCGLLDVARAHGKPIAGPFPYFRVQPIIIAEGQRLTDFSWTDGLSETRLVLQALSAAITGLVHDDADQGWAVSVVTTATTTCLIEWDGEGSAPAGLGFAFDRSELAQQARAALVRLHAVHTRLVAALGRNYWV